VTPLRGKICKFMSLPGLTEARKEEFMRSFAWLKNYRKRPAAADGDFDNHAATRFGLGMGRRLVDGPRYRSRSLAAQPPLDAGALRQRRHRPDRRSENPAARSALGDADKPPANVLRRMAAAARIRSAWTFGLMRSAAVRGWAMSPVLNSGLEEKMIFATAFKNFAPKGSRRPSSAAF